MESEKTIEKKITLTDEKGEIQDSSVKETSGMTKSQKYWGWIILGIISFFSHLELVKMVIREIGITEIPALSPLGIMGLIPWFCVLAAFYVKYDTCIQSQTGEEESNNDS